MASYRKLKKSAKKEGKFAALAAALAAPAIGSAAPAATKSLTMPVGIPGVNLKTISREVPADEPPVLPVNDKLSVLGKRTRRLDAHLKVTGQAKYTYDVNLPGMLFGRMYRSPHPHATVKSVDTSAAERYPGVKAVYIIETVMGSAIERDPNHKNPKVQSTGGKFPKVRYVGQPIAAVAATTQQAADEAARLIKVDYELLPFVTDMDEARKPDAPLVYGGKQVSMEESGGGGGAAGACPRKATCAAHPQKACLAARAATSKKALRKLKSL
ncbi:xanthine dehydrogenase family protein molybdopterin-binding subunit [Hymenobacter radiodurans]|uniref:xanthine dehydrogenase family protein molybdopterin-binding subunit n=1 Tax=Hymenobacter radiodurans TaxID=2496028 RepID=UPI00196BA8E9|nr:xanthine dehydrogenase family protein molybdopterin-binding subunit [Hymenobacter radiodurans]